jgi:hypothetical protein
MFNRATVISLFTGLSVAASLAGGPSIASAASPSASAAPKLASITPLNPGTNHVVTASPQPGSHPPVGQPQGGGSAGNGNGGGIETMTLQPSNLMTSNHGYWANNDGPPYCGSHTNGLGPEQPNPGQILVGYDRYWDPGTQPFPCWETSDHVYRGAVKFDPTPWLHDLIEPNKFLITAKLRFDVSYEDWGCPATADLLQANVDWTGGTPDLIPGDEMFSVPITDQHTNEVDVSMAVRRWLAYNDAGDNGFVFRQSDETYPQQNATCIGHVSKLALDLQYVPAN